MKYNNHFGVVESSYEDVELSAELEALAEVMAENVHNVWAETRLSQGWSLGPERNDALKQHPCLVPYSELPASEQLYDRNTALSTLRLITSLGYDIVKRK